MEKAKMDVLAISYNKAFKVSKEEYEKISKHKTDPVVAKRISTEAEKFRSKCITNDVTKETPSFNNILVLKKKK